MAIDGYFIGWQLKEVEPLLKDSILRKITTVGKAQAVFSFYKKGQTYNLLLDSSPNSAHFRFIDTFNKEADTSFFQNLKQHLLNATLTSLKQHLKDRIVFFEFRRNDPFKGGYLQTLVFEIMGRNTNLILLDENHMIKDAINKRFSDTGRSILPNLKYETFPTPKILFNINDLHNIDSPLTLFKNYLGFSKELADVTFNNKLNLEDISLMPTLYENKRLSFHAIDLMLDGEKKSFGNTSSLLQYYYDKTLKSDNFIISTIIKELKRQTHKRGKLKEDYGRNENYEIYKEIADSIYSSGFNLNEKHSSYMDHNLDSQLTLNQNAQKLYQKYRKFKTSLTHIHREITQTDALIEYLNDIKESYPLYSYLDLEDIKKELIALHIIKPKKTKTERKSSSTFKQYQLDDAVCFVGKTMNQNEILFNKAHPNDLWFHVKGYPGAHVFLKGKISDDNILFSAKKALENSSLNKQKSGEVIYTTVRYLKRLKNKPGFYLNYSKEKAIKVNLD